VSLPCLRGDFTFFFVRRPFPALDDSVDDEIFVPLPFPFSCG